MVAEYLSIDPSFCDVENVLFYNVGTASFAAHVRRNLRFQRAFSAPSIPPSGMQRAHQHRYETHSSSPPRWRRRRDLGERRFQLPTKLRATTIWAAARGAALSHALETAAREVGLHVRLTLPTSSMVGLHSSMKALLDGIVASFHRHDGTGDVEELSSRVAGQLGSTPADVQRLLIEGPAELGTRGLLHAFGREVQWNPADDLLVSVHLAVERADVSRADCLATLIEVERA